MRFRLLLISNFFIIQNSFVCILIFLFLSSCKKQEINISPTPKNFAEIFDTFWYKMNDQYGYWDIEKTNWDSVYIHYKPLFNALSNSDADQRKAVMYFRKMTARIVDGHYRITFNQKPLLDSIINPSINRKSLDTKFHAPYNYSELVIPYLDSGYYSAKGSIISDNALIRVITGTIKQNLLYFNCNFFSLNRSFEAGDIQIQQALSYFFSKLNNSSNLKGIILDLRNNYGGEISDLNYLAGKLVTDNTLFGYTRSKTGLGRVSYLPWVEARIIHDPAYHNPYPIIILTDSFTASLCETTIIALKANQRCLTIGENTYGATGPLSDPKIFNSGSFNVGEIMNIETSSVEFKTVDNKIIESQGIAPDINIPFNIRTISTGVDSQLEAAISILKAR